MKFTSFINHSFVPIRNHAPIIPIINPSTGNTLKNFSFVASTTEDVKNAIESAFQARDSLWKSGVDKRIEWLRDIRIQIEKDRELLARLECLDNGKTIKEARADVEDVITCFKVYEEYGEKYRHILNGGLEEIINPLTKKPVPTCGMYKQYVPVGAVSAILPFNYPLSMISWKLCPSLVAGCPIILKPSENTMLTSYMLAKYISNISDLPKGAINIVYGDGKTSDAIQRLTKDPKISKVAFTGSVATGMKIAETCAKTFTRCSIEAGGKSPMIIFSDYFEKEEHWNNCIDWIMTGIIANKGEICSATSRLIVEKNIYQEFLQRLKQRLDTLIVDVTCPDEDADLLLSGNEKIDASQTSSRKSQMGPVVSEGQYKKIKNFLAIAAEEGCKQLDLNIDIPSTGFFIKPTVFYDVKKENTVWREEIFGPVLCVTSFESEEEAIDLATDSWNGLTSAVFTSDEQRFDRLQSQLRTGTVWWNTSQINVSFAPWGGFGLSGIGRELSDEGLFEFLEVKTVIKNRNKMSVDDFSL